jgi:serine protease Do
MKASRSILAATLVAGAIIGIALTVSTKWESCSSAERAETVQLLPVTLPETSSLTLPDFASLAERVSPSVVYISTVSDESSRSLSRRGGDPFEHFFPRPPSRGLGSGFVLDEEGYIITNHHVVEDASKVVVRFNDETEYEAEVIGTDAKTDLAVLKIDRHEGLVPVALGDSDSLRVGEWVLAIGNPFGLEYSVTAGIVSAKGRHINRPGSNAYDDFIQTDAAINPGNSGGPLVNMSGQVVGINSAIFSRSGGNIGIGFAIPVNMARQFVPQLKEHGHVTRGWLGVLIQPVDKDIAESLELPTATGALVAKVFPDSPAESGGVKVGDVIVEFDGKTVKKSLDLPSLVAETAVSKSVDVVVLRDGERRTLNIEIGKLEGEPEASMPVRAEILGLSVQDITDEVAKELDLGPDPRGVVVTAVANGSPAERAAIRPGDVIEQIGREPVTSTAEFRRLLGERGEGESVIVLVRRGDQSLFKVIKPTEE